MPVLPPPATARLVRLSTFRQPPELHGFQPPLQRTVSSSRLSMEPDTARTGFFERQSCNGLAEQHQAGGMS